MVFSYKYFSYKYKYFHQEVKTENAVSLALSAPWFFKICFIQQILDLKVTKKTIVKNS